MTLAGTRPPTVDEWEKYELHHRARLAAKPGLTFDYDKEGFLYPQIDFQDNQSMSTKGVLRGLHFQKQYPQGKLVRLEI